MLQKLNVREVVEPFYRSRCTSLKLFSVINTFLQITQSYLYGVFEVGKDKGAVEWEEHYWHQVYEHTSDKK